MTVGELIAELECYDDTTIVEIRNLFGDYYEVHARVRGTELTILIT